MKLLATDYDGTLRYAQDVMPEDLKSIEEWKNKGNKFVIVTGRSKESIDAQIKLFNLPCDYLITNNGGMVFDENGNVLEEEQYESLEQYLKSMSYKINSKLYNNEKLSKDDKEYIQNLDNALKGMPTYKGWVKRCVYVRDSEDVSKVLSIFEKKKKSCTYQIQFTRRFSYYGRSEAESCRILRKSETMQDPCSLLCTG